MKYILSIILILITTLTSYADPGIFVESLEDAVSISEHSNTDVLIVFGAERCGACKKLKNDLHNNTNMSDDLIICSIDIDQNKSLAQEYRVRTIPDCILLRNMKEIKRQKGYSDSKKFIKWLDR